MRDPQAASASSSGQRVLDPTTQIKVAYVQPSAVHEWLDTSGTFPLGIVSFGASMPLPLSCPVVEVALPLLDGPSRCEVWSCDQPVRFHRQDEISVAFAGDLLFGSITAYEERDAGLDQTTEKAYGQVLRLLHDSGFHLWRIWNYFPRINGEERGLERYRLFCMGRHEALARTLEGFPGSLPAGTAVGTQHGPLQIYFLAGSQPPTHLGNPRQVNAYDYPAIYGPRSPSFARATLSRSDSATQLFISGTASVVGHQSQHIGSADLQALETVKNLRALMDCAQFADPIEPSAPKRHSIFKVYVRSPKHLKAVRDVLRARFLLSGDLLFLQGDLCRRELLVEVEGLVSAD